MRVRVALRIWDWSLRNVDLIRAACMCQGIWNDIFITIELRVHLETLKSPSRGNFAIGNHFEWELESYVFVLLRKSKWEWDWQIEIKVKEICQATCQHIWVTGRADERWNLNAAAAQEKEIRKCVCECDFIIFFLFRLCLFKILDLFYPPRKVKWDARCSAERFIILEIMFLGVIFYF